MLVIYACGWHKHVCGWVRNFIVGKKICSWKKDLWLASIALSLRDKALLLIPSCLYLNHKFRDGPRRICG